MVVPKTSAVRPKGSVIEGKDKTGRRYKYVVGQRGRVKLGDAQQPSGGGGKAPAAPKDVAIRARAANAVASKQSSVHARAMAKKILASHAEWEKSGDLYTAGRLSQLFDKGRDKLLKQGNKSEAHRAFAGVVLATIFHSNYHGKKSGGKYNIVFNAGGGGKQGYIKFKTKDGKDVGGISFNDITKIGDQDLAKAKSMFHSLAEKAKGAGKTGGHKSAAKEHTAMVQALSVKPPAVENRQASTAKVATDGSSKPAEQPTKDFLNKPNISKASTKAIEKVAKKKEVLPGGKGDKKPDSAFAKKDLKKGMKVESEHTKNKKVQKEIAKDHLTEDPKYYSRLAKVEKEAKTENKPKKKRKKWVKGKPKPYNKGNRWKYKFGPGSAAQQVIDAQRDLSEAKIKKEQRDRIRKG